MKLWEMYYLQWFGAKYRLNAADRLALSDYSSSKPPEKEQTALMLRAMAAWIDRENAVDEHDSGFQPFFYRTRFNRLAFAIRNIEGLKNELETQNSEAAAWSWQQVVAIVQDGREKYLSAEDCDESAAYVEGS